MSPLAIRPLLLWFVLCATTLRTVFAANSFAGSNLYYAGALYDNDSETLLKGLQSAGMKVLRVWLDPEESGSQKGTKLNPHPALEDKGICNGDASCYDDTVLQRYDAFMIKAQQYGIKLLISMHSFNSLQAGDVYSKKYGVSGFYTQSAPQQEFDARLVHILNHNHTTLGKPWKELKDYIFAFEAENEAMIGQGQSFVQNNAGWQCSRATTIKGQLGNDSGILVVTGGESWLSESVQKAFLTCPDLDVISIHSYGGGDLSKETLDPYVQQAKDANKMLLLEEWGACYFATSNNNCPSGKVLDSKTRNDNIAQWANGITAAGIPWLYWQVVPNADPHGGVDYEVGLNSDPSWDTLKSAALAAANATAAFDFSAYLL
ncbi:glycoside hydrolase [Amylocystis lapponica]|nr:glycoside hydrolase [Amylocystis lapponica]